MRQQPIEAEIRVMRARSRRVSRWVALCTCEWQSDLCSKKERAKEAAFVHGREIHGRAARIVVPAA